MTQPALQAFGEPAVNMNVCVIVMELVIESLEFVSAPRDIPCPTVHIVRNLNVMCLQDWNNIFWRGDEQSIVSTVELLNMIAIPLGLRRPVTVYVIYITKQKQQLLPFPPVIVGQSPGHIALGRCSLPIDLLGLYWLHSPERVGGAPERAFV